MASQMMMRAAWRRCSAATTASVLPPARVPIHVRVGSAPPRSFSAPPKLGTHSHILPAARPVNLATTAGTTVSPLVQRAFSTSIRTATRLPAPALPSVDAPSGTLDWYTAAVEAAFEKADYAGVVAVLKKFWREKPGFFLRPVTAERVLQSVFVCHDYAALELLLGSPAQPAIVADMDNASLVLSSFGSFAPVYLLPRITKTVERHQPHLLSKLLSVWARARDGPYVTQLVRSLGQSLPAEQRVTPEFVQTLLFCFTVLQDKERLGKVWEGAVAAPTPAAVRHRRRSATTMLGRQDDPLDAQRELELKIAQRQEIVDRGIEEHLDRGPLNRFHDIVVRDEEGPTLEVDARMAAQAAREKAEFGFDKSFDPTTAAEFDLEDLGSFDETRLPMHVDMHNAVLEGLAERGDHAAAYDYAKEMWLTVAPNTRTFEVLMYTLAVDAQDVSALLGLWKRSAKEKVARSAEMYAAVAHAYGAHGEVDAMEKWLQRLRSADLPPGSFGRNTYPLLVSGFLQADQPARALEITQEMEAYDYNSPGQAPDRAQVYHDWCARAVAERNVTDALAWHSKLRLVRALPEYELESALSQLLVHHAQQLAGVESSSPSSSQFTSVDELVSAAAPVYSSLLHGTRSYRAPVLWKPMHKILSLPHEMVADDNPLHAAWAQLRELRKGQESQWRDILSPPAALPAVAADKLAAGLSDLESQSDVDIGLWSAEDLPAPTNPAEAQMMADLTSASELLLGPEVEDDGSPQAQLIRQFQQLLQADTDTAGMASPLHNMDPSAAHEIARMMQGSPEEWMRSVYGVDTKVAAPPAPPTSADSQLPTMRGLLEDLAADLPVSSDSSDPEYARPVYDSEADSARKRYMLQRRRSQYLQRRKQALKADRAWLAAALKDTESMLPESLAQRSGVASAVAELEPLVDDDFYEVPDYASLHMFNPAMAPSPTNIYPNGHPYGGQHSKYYHGAEHPKDWQPTDSDAASMEVEAPDTSLKFPQWDWERFNDPKKPRPLIGVNEREHSKIAKFRSRKWLEAVGVDLDSPLVWDRPRVHMASRDVLHYNHIRQETLEKIYSRTKFLDEKFETEDEMIFFYETLDDEAPTDYAASGSFERTSGPRTPMRDTRTVLKAAEIDDEKPGFLSDALSGKIPVADFYQEPQKPFLESGTSPELEADSNTAAIGTSTDNVSGTATNDASGTALAGNPTTNAPAPAPEDKEELPPLEVPISTIAQGVHPVAHPDDRLPRFFVDQFGNPTDPTDVTAREVFFHSKGVRRLPLPDVDNEDEWAIHGLVQRRYFEKVASFERFRSMLSRADVPRDKYVNNNPEFIPPPSPEIKAAIDSVIDMDKYPEDLAPPKEWNELDADGATVEKVTKELYLSGQNDAKNDVVVVPRKYQVDLDLAKRLGGSIPPIRTVDDVTRLAEAVVYRQLDMGGAGLADQPFGNIADSQFGMTRERWAQHFIDHFTQLARDAPTPSALRGLGSYLVGLTRTPEDTLEDIASARLALAAEHRKKAVMEDYKLPWWKRQDVSFVASSGGNNKNSNSFVPEALTDCDDDEADIVAWPSLPMISEPYLFARSPSYSANTRSLGLHEMFFAAKDAVAASRRREEDERQILRAEVDNRLDADTSTLHPPVAAGLGYWYQLLSLGGPSFAATRDALLFCLAPNWAQNGGDVRSPRIIPAARRALYAALQDAAQSKSSSLSTEQVRALYQQLAKFVLPPPQRAQLLRLLLLRGLYLEAAALVNSAVRARAVLPRHLVGALQQVLSGHAAVKLADGETLPDFCPPPGHDSAALPQLAKQVEQDLSQYDLL